MLLGFSHLNLYLTANFTILNAIDTYFEDISDPMIIWCEMSFDPLDRMHETNCIIYSGISDEALSSVVIASKRELWSHLCATRWRLGTSSGHTLLRSWLQRFFTAGSSGFGIVPGLTRRFGSGDDCRRNHQVFVVSSGEVFFTILVVRLKL